MLRACQLWPATLLRKHLLNHAPALPHDHDPPPPPPKKTNETTNEKCLGTPGIHSALSKRHISVDTIGILFVQLIYVTVCEYYIKLHFRVRCHLRITYPFLAAILQNPETNDVLKLFRQLCNAHGKRNWRLKRYCVPPKKKQPTRAFCCHPMKKKPQG